MDARDATVRSAGKAGGLRVWKSNSQERRFWRRGAQRTFSLNYAPPASAPRAGYPCGERLKPCGCALRGRNGRRARDCRGSRECRFTERGEGLVLVNYVVQKKIKASAFQRESEGARLTRFDGNCGSLQSQSGLRITIALSAPTRRTNKPQQNGRGSCLDFLASKLARMARPITTRR